MRCTPIVTGLVLSSIVFTPAFGQVVVDVSKITCDQYVHSKITAPNLIAAWLSGYYNAKRNKKIIDLESLEDNVSKVKNYCYDEKNFKVRAGLKNLNETISGVSA